MTIDVFTYGSLPKYMRDIEELIGETIFDNYSHDPARMLAQIKEATGVELSPAQLSPENLVAAVQAAVDEGGGDDRPDWVPENAKIHIDLVGGTPQGRAWVDGVGEVAVDTLLGSDPNTENAWGSTSYDAERLTADGYVPGSSTPVALIGDLLSRLLAGATIVIGFKQVSDPFVKSFAVVSADGNDALQVDAYPISGNQVEIESWSGPLDVLTSGGVVNAGAGAINVLAITVTDARLEVAANGVSGDILDGDLVDADRPAANSLVAALIDCSDEAIQFITTREKLPSTDGLSELSQTGVVNTAPHDITVEAAGSFVVDGTTLTIAGGSVSANSGIGNFFATDAEGNPLVWSISGTDAGQFYFDTNLLKWTSDQSEVSFTVTIRATDPGGLYVEQEFTITVTA